MTRYFLRTEFFEGDAATDDEAVFFDSIEAARAEAKAGILELITVAIREDMRTPRRIVIVEEGGREIDALNAADLIPEQFRRPG